MPATIRYNTLRLAMVLVVGAVCYVLGARGLTLAVLALLISMPLSFVLLARWRKAMIEEFAAGRGSGLNPLRAVGRRIDAANRAEDDAVDRAGAEPGEPRTGTDAGTDAVSDGTGGREPGTDGERPTGP